MSLSLSFPSQVYSSSNKPSADTLKSDLSAVQVAFNALAESLYPVGIIVEFKVSTNPGTLLGFGTWAAFGTGRVTVAIDSGQTEFDTVEETGGEKTHTLTESEIPSHRHTIYTTSGDTTGSGSLPNRTNDSGSYDQNTGYAGGGDAHNNLQPYIVVYRWVRTA